MRRHASIYSLTVLSLSLIALALPALAQIAGANLVTACPAACGIKIRITSTLLRETPNGIDAVIDWTLEQTAPEIKVSSFQVTGVVEFKSRSKDETTISVSGTQRQAVVRLSQSGKNKDIKFSDVTSVRAIVTAIADALPPIPVTNIPTRKITGQGGDSAVEVTWVPPAPLPCSADVFNISVAATNEKGDRLTGNANASLSGRNGKVELKGSVNKKGLRDPEATVKVVNSLIACQQTTNFAPKQEGISAGVGSASASSSKVTIKNITFRESSGRIDTTVDWDVVEAGGVKATNFNLKFEFEDPTGKITVNNRVASANDRSTFGIQVASGTLRSLTLTITATFKNSGNTVVLTKEDKKTQAFNIKQAVKPVAELAPAVQKPVAPQPQDIGLNIANVKITTTTGLHTVATSWQVNIPVGVTVTSFEVEASVAGNQTKAKRSAVVLGQVRQTTINFAFDEVGNKLNNAQIKVIANARRADGSTFQQTATRNSN